MATRATVTAATLWSALTVGLVLLFQLASSVVSSRILPPADFGVLAFSISLAALLNQLSYLGVESALVQKASMDETDLDVVWSFELARQGVLIAILLALTPLLARWIHDERMYWIVPANCVAILITALRNNGVIAFRRQLHFRPLLFLDVLPVMVQALMTVGLLLLWRDIAVVVIGIVLNAAIGTGLTHRLSPGRRRLCWDWPRLRRCLSFGGFLLGNTIVQMIRDQGVVFALGALSGKVVLGFYSRSRVFSVNIFNQAVNLIWRVGYPLFSAQHHAGGGLARSFRGLCALLLLAVPPAMALYASLAPDFLPWLLSPQWQPCVPLVQLFCLEGTLLFLLIPAEIAFQAIGRPQYGTVRQAVAGLIFLSLTYPLVQRFGVQGVIWANIAAVSLTLPSYVRRVQQSVFPCSWRTVVRWCLPPALASAALWFTYGLVRAGVAAPLARMAVGAVAALLAYAVVYLALLATVARGQGLALADSLPQRWSHALRVRT